MKIPSKRKENQPRYSSKWFILAQLILTRRQGAGIDNVSSFLLNFLGNFSKWRTSQGHQTGSGGFQDTEGTDEFEEGIDTGWFGGSILISLEK